jgi:putative transposase
MKEIVMSKLMHGRTCVFNINYQIVWSTKYRRKVLTSKIETRLKEILIDVGKQKGFEIAEIEVGMKDHVHVFVSAIPKISISYIAKMMKGISGRLLLKEFPKLSKQLYKGELWNPSYYVETIGSISEEAIRQYIQDQEKE